MPYCVRGPYRDKYPHTTGNDPHGLARWSLGTFLGSYPFFGFSTVVARVLAQWCYSSRMVATKDTPGEVIEEPSLEFQSLESEATKLLTPREFDILKSICVAVGKDGMTVEEACQLSNVSYVVLKALAEKHLVVGRIIALKELEYKRSLMKALSAKARSGDDKVSQWLLEQRYPEEFGSKRKKDSNDSGDMLKEAIAFIQERGDATPIISRTTPAPLAPTGSPVGKDAVRRLQQFLT